MADKKDLQIIISGENKTKQVFKEVSNDLESTEKKTKTLGERLSSFGGSMATMGKAVAIGTGAVATGIGAVAVSSVKAFAEYEQLVGGVETLFKDSSAEILKYSDNAYKTAGMSANEYMSTITSFSASLLQGLGGDTKKAAEIGNLAVTDMSDNANKMGTGIEMIQNAYQGFAKQNYSMLDNLKLGYGGSAGEMARLINASGVMGKEFEATAENVKNIPFNKMIEAIHQVQTEMGITGTTALEASATISGSWGSLKSAWTNMLVFFTGESNQTWDEAFGGLKTSAENFINNVAPALKNAVLGIFKAFGEVTGLDDYFGPMEGKIRGFVDDITTKLKPAMDVMKAMLDSIVAALTPLMPEIDKAKIAFMELAPQLKQLAEIIGVIAVGAIVLLVGNVVALVSGLVKAADDIAVIIGGILKVFNGLISFIQNVFTFQWRAAFDSLKLVVSGLWDMFSGTIGAILSLLSGFVEGFIGYAKHLYDVLLGHSIIPDIVLGIRDWFAKIPEMVLGGINGFVDSVTSAFTGLKNSVINTMENLYNEVFRIVNKIKSAMSEVSSAWSNAGSNISWALSGKKASGGFVGSGRSYLVGEQGPEIFTPSGNGSITPNGRLGGTTYNINIEIKGNTLLDDRAGEVIGDQIARRLGFANPY